MNDSDITRPPGALATIRQDAGRIGFTLSSEPKTGVLLRPLAASKPAGRFLELGIGAGVGTAWLLDGMDAQSQLVSVDTDAAVHRVLRVLRGYCSLISLISM